MLGLDKLMAQFLGGVDPQEFAQQIQTVIAAGERLERVELKIDRLAAATVALATAVKGLSDGGRFGRGVVGEAEGGASQLDCGRTGNEGGEAEGSRSGEGSGEGNSAQANSGGRSGEGEGQIEGRAHEQETREIVQGNVGRRTFSFEG